MSKKVMNTARAGGGRKGAKATAAAAPGVPVFGNGGNVLVYGYRGTMPVRWIWADSLPCSECNDYLYRELRGDFYSTEAGGDSGDTLFGGLGGDAPAGTA